MHRDEFIDIHDLGSLDLKDSKFLFNKKLQTEVVGAVGMLYHWKEVANNQAQIGSWLCTL
jgi:hypothetical protein